MPVTTKHKEYQRLVGPWTRVRDTIEGEHAVKKKGPAYLPIPAGMINEGTAAKKAVASLRPGPDGLYPTQSWADYQLGGDSAEYEEYLSRAVFYGAVSRTVTGITGAMLRKDPDNNWPKSREDVLKTVTRSGDSFEQLIRLAVQETVAVTRFGLLVDAPEAFIGDTNPEPYVSTFVAERIINWRSAVVGDRKVPVMVVLEEDLDQQVDQFTIEKEARWRVLRFGMIDLETVALDEAMALLTEEQQSRGEEPPFEDRLGYYGLEIDELQAPIFWHEVWKETDESRQKNHSDEKDKEYELERRVFPRRFGGLLWDEMPFVFINEEDLTAEPVTPVIIDLVDMALAHYRNSADLEWGLHLTALPTPYAAGFELKEGQVLRVGGATAWVTDETQAKAGMVEFSGQGLGAIREEMDRKEKRMAVLGARLLEDQKKAQEAAETVRLRQSGDGSIIKTIGDTVSRGMTQVLRHLAKWRGEENPNLTLELRPDLNHTKLTAQEMTALSAALQSGSISFATYFYVLSTGDMYPDGWTEDQERAAISTGLPGIPQEDQEDEEEDDETQDTEEDDETSETSSEDDEDED